MSGSIEVTDGARNRLATTVAALRQRACYPGEVREVEAIETHMAWVFLTERYAYKLKKPLRTGLIDYTSVEARRQACETELRLNRRLAAPVYLDVVPVANTNEGMRVGGDGPVVDWLVKMRRLPHDQMLDTCIERGCVREDAVRQVSAKRTAFYGRGESLHWSPATYRGRIRANIRAKAAALERPHYGLDASSTRALAASQMHWIEAHRDRLGRRGAHVMDVHGDLRPEYVCLTDPPMIIDCLEFNRSLRLHDPVSDLAFLSLECRRLGAGWIGNRLLSLYQQKTGDNVDPVLIPFYESYHALIRATITIWHLDDAALVHSEVWRRRAQEYLRLAQQRLPFA